MKEQSKNFIFNVGYQLVMYLFPLVTAAYISRVLGAENLGTYSYVSSIVTICGMFCLLGISNYGNREIAKIRDDYDLRCKTFSEIFSLQLLLSVTVIIIYCVIIFALNIEYKSLFIIEILNLLAISFDISWLFFGMEHFKITLTRNFLVKCVSMIFIVIFVRSSKDLPIYTVIMCLSALFSQLFLLVISRKLVRFRFVFNATLIKHLKPCLVLFIPVIAFSIYRVMDKTMIGTFSTKTELAFYDNAERIINIPLMVINALGTVMLPYMAHSIHNNGEEYKQTIKESMHLATIIATFSVIGIIVLGNDIAILLYGNSFLKSGLLMKILSITIIASAWANVIRTQYLIPNSKDRTYVISTVIGAVVNFICNMIFIRLYGSIGACIGTILAEFSIAIFQTVAVYKELEIIKYVKDFLLNLAKALLMGIIISCIVYFVRPIYIRIISCLFIAMLLFIILDRRYLFNVFLSKK